MSRSSAPAGLDPHAPVLAGWAAVEQREQDPWSAEDAVGLMVRAARSLLPEQLAEAILPSVGWVAAPDGSTSSPAAPRLVAEAIGAKGAHIVLAEVGILQQTLISTACRLVQEGTVDFALVAGGEARYRDTRARASGISLPPPSDSAAPDEVLRPDAPLVLPAEVRAGLAGAPGFYALLESEWRARHGLGHAAHRDGIASRYARFSEIASGNPHATRREVRRVEEIRDPSPGNPMLAYPYTKLMTTTWTVDQASAFLFCTAATAARAGVPRDRWRFPLVAAESNHAVPVSARSTLTQPAAMRVLADTAHHHLGFSPADVDLFDLYSCFPIAVTLAAEGLGIPEGRDLTVTGGMSFAGGPFNNAMLQGLARMADLLSGGDAATGLVSCVSGLYTKLGFTLLGSEPPAVPFRVLDLTEEVAQQEPALPVVDTTSASGTIAAYTVLYDAGAPERAVAVVDVPDRRRMVARSHDRKVIDNLLAEEGVGRRVAVDAGVFHLA